MSPQTFLIVFFHVFMAALDKVLPEVTGSLGNNITLNSGADPSWNLTKIEWSIFSNNTWIATCRRGIINTRRVDRYIGRLSLNKFTGSLTIHNLTQEDGMEYTVDLTNTMKNNAVNKIKLKVMKQVEAPSIKTLMTTRGEEGCWVALQCSTQDESVELSWDKPSTAKIYSINNTAETNSVLLAFLNTQETQAKFTCTSSRAMEKASKDETVKLPDKPSTWSPSALCFFIGLFLGLTPFIYMNREKLKKTWEGVRDLIADFNSNNVTTATTAP